MAADISIVVKLTRQDLRRVLLRRLDKKLIPYAVTPFLLLMIFFSVASHFVVENPPNYLKYVVLGLIFGSSISVMLLRVFVIFRRASIAEKKQQTTTYTFSEMGVVTDNANQSTITKWAAFMWFLEAKHDLLLAGESFAMQIPKRFLEDGKMAILKQTLKERAGKEVFFIR